MPADDGAKVVRGDVGNVEAADFSAALDECHYRLLRGRRLVDPTPGLAANIGFINLDGMTSAANGRGDPIPSLFHACGACVSFRACSQRLPPGGCPCPPGGLSGLPLGFLPITTFGHQFFPHGQ
jgi:hypothetical protein